MWRSCGLVVVVCGVSIFRTSPSVACSCVGGRHEGFLTSASDGGEEAAVHLPSNAKGVLFLLPPVADSSLPTGASFEARDTSSGQKLQLTVRELDVLRQRGRAYERLAPQDPRCLDGSPGARDQVHCAPERAVPASARIVRLEPTSGLTPGRRYRFQARHDFGGRPLPHPTLVVDVDAIELLPSALSEVRLRADGPATTRDLPVLTITGACSAQSSSLAQSVTFELPSTMVQYKHLARFATLVAASGGPYRLWRYERSLCSDPEIGRNDGAIGSDTFFVACASDSFSNAFAGADYKLEGVVAIPEVFDEERTTAELAVHLDRRAAGQCSAAAPSTPLPRRSCNCAIPGAERGEVGGLGGVAVAVAAWLGRRKAHASRRSLVAGLRAERAPATSRRRRRRG